MRRSYVALFFGGLAYAAIVALVLTGFGSPLVRIVVGLPLALFLPGYALTAACIPSATLRSAEHCLCAFGFTLCIDALGAFLLNGIPWGLQLRTWAIFLGGITLVASIVAFVNRRAGPMGERGAGIRWRDGLLFGGVFLVLLGAIGLSYAGAILQPTTGFTQFWLAPAVRAESRAIYLGVRNEEGTTMQYTIQLAMGGRVVAEWPEITLSPDAQWETTVALPLNQRAETMEALLYRLDQPQVIYRHLAIP